MKLTVQSSAFTQEKMIPIQNTCDGKNITPPVQWSNVPDGTKSFALVMDDPDAPAKTWVHWVFYNIPGDQRKLDEGLPIQDQLDNGAIYGINDFKNVSYGGPCPPSGSPHQYVLKLYALDSLLDLKPGATKQKLLDMMDGHVLEKAEIKAKYKRQ